MTTPTPSPGRKDPLETAFQRLQRMLPGPLSRALRWLHHPQSRLVRIPLGVLCICGGLLAFLPVLGIELLPLGLLLIAQDIPFLHRPIGRMNLRLLDIFEALQRRWMAWRRSRSRSRAQP
jgi:hypothetical protein